jgi:TPR repeat protein
MLLPSPEFICSQRVGIEASKIWLTSLRPYLRRKSARLRKERVGLRVIHKHLVVASLVAAVAVPALAQNVKAGIEAWQQADYSRAVTIWRPLAEKGNADAQFDLGEAYRLGRGVPINLGAAATWFERAAKQGHLDAQRILGLLLFQNGDRVNGLKWLKMAATRDDAGAMLVYGTALVNGDGVKRDPVLGYSFVTRAAAKGFAPAKDTLADLDRLLTPDQRKKGAAIALGEVNQPAATKTTPRLARSNGKQLAITRPPEGYAPPLAGPAPSPVTGDWRIQLGAFSQRASAEALFGKLASNPQLAGRRPYYIPVGAMTRLQAGPFASKSAATAACKAIGTACFAVPAR